MPTFVLTDSGRLSAGGVIVQRRIDGREPASVADRLPVAGELHRLPLEDGSRADAWPAMPRPQTGPNRDRTSRTARPRLVAVRRSARRGARSRMTSGDSVPSP